jgi:hypothetical protein
LQSVFKTFKALRSKITWKTVTTTIVFIVVPGSLIGGAAWYIYRRFRKKTAANDNAS